MLSILLRIYQSIFGLSARLGVLETKIDSLTKTLQSIIDLLTPGPATTISFNVFRDDGSVQEGISMETIRDDQKETLTISVTDKKGAPAVLDGVPVWASSDATIVTVAPATDGMSAVVTGVTPGTAKVTVTGDADLGAGVSPIVGSIDFTVTGGGATQIAITGSTPVDQ